MNCVYEFFKKIVNAKEVVERNPFVQDPTPRPVGREGVILWSVIVKSLECSYLSFAQDSIEERPASSCEHFSSVARFDDGVSSAGRGCSEGLYQ